MLSVSTPLHRARRWLALAAVAGLLLLVLLPRACDPRREELPLARYAELEAFSGTRTRAQVEAALKIVDPGGALASYLRLDDSALEVRLAPGDREAAAHVVLRATPAPARPWPRQRIAVDPGHWGGAWSQIENRHTVRDGGPPVREGDLTWATARLLAARLSSAGREAPLLRGPPPTEAFPRGANPAYAPQDEVGLWLAEHRPQASSWRTPWSVFDVWQVGRRFARDSPFELHTHWDLRRRAAEAGRLSADVTLSLHYDYSPSGGNGILVFIPGAFEADELVTASQRFWALRRVLDGTLEETARLARDLAGGLMQQLDLPALTAAHFGELGKSWVPIDEARGVYARNLAILRRTPGVVVSIEGPCMNEPGEYRRLLGTELEIDGRRYPARLRGYAEGVLEGLGLGAPATGPGARGSPPPRRVW